LLRSGVVAAAGGDATPPSRAFARAWKGEDASLRICSHLAALAVFVLGMADAERAALVEPFACKTLVGVTGSWGA
jgi:hypothetical protein